MSNVAYLIFDIEAIADGELISRIRYPGEGLSAPEATARYRSEQLAETGKDILPWLKWIAIIGCSTW